MELHAAGPTRYPPVGGGTLGSRNDADTNWSEPDGLHLEHSEIGSHPHATGEDAPCAGLGRLHGSWGLTSGDKRVPPYVWACSGQRSHG